MRKFPGGPGRMERTISKRAQVGAKIHEREQKGGGIAKRKKRGSSGLKRTIVKGFWGSQLKRNSERRG